MTFIAGDRTHLLSVAEPSSVVDDLSRGCKVVLLAAHGRKQPAVTGGITPAVRRLSQGAELR